MKLAKFMARAGDPRIQLVEIEKETAACVWIKGWTYGGGDGSGNERKHAKRSSFDNYFDSWQEAHDFLMANAERRLTQIRNELARAQAHHGNVKGMKPPQEAA